MTTTDSSPKKRRGCLFYGCATMLVLLLLFCLLAFFTVRWMKGQINAYTDSSAVQLPKVEMVESEFKALDQRVKTFSEAVQQGKPSQTLVLTERDINALIAKAPNMKELASRVYVSITNNQIKGQVSIPLRGIASFASDRYLNGEAAFNVSMQNGVLTVTAQDVKVKGKPLPEVFMKELRKRNLAEEFLRDPKNAEAISKLESIQVEDDHVTIKARSAN
jgi:hypothetical protein